MIVEVNQVAPDFDASDIQGNPARLSDLHGKKILLTFYRHVGCPVTNLRFLELSKYDSLFGNKGLVVLAIFESSVANLLRYCEAENFYARLIANPEFNLYEQYSIEQNTLKILYSMYRGVHAKSEAGKKRFKAVFEPEGHPHLLGGEFLVNEEGIIKKAYYSQYLGDHMLISDILKFIEI